MTYENIKSVVLTILIITSILLTYTLWTYQPNFDVMENSRTVQEVSLGEKKEVRKIVKPDQIFYHQRNNHFGTVDSVEIDKVIKELSKWSFYEFEDITGEMMELQTFIYEKRSTELIFPDVIALELYKNVLDIKDKEALDITFDRILIDMEKTSEEEAFVYFVLTDKKQIFRSRVTASFVASLDTNYYKEASKNPKLSSYTPYNLSDKRYLLVPTEKTTMTLYNYLLDPLPTEKFRDALFSDPSVVQKNFIASGEEYTDGSTLMSVNYDTNTIFYVNPAQENNFSNSVGSLIQRSIDFVNSHGGWTDNYRYVGMDDVGQFIMFRLYDPNGYPIFSDNGMSEILQEWGQNEISKYLRNNFTLGRRIQSTEITLISGIDVMRILEKSKEINLEFLQSLMLGYKMTKDSQGPLIHLEPTWFYKYNDQWFIIPTDKKGDLKHGLE